MTEETRMKGLYDHYNALDKAFEEEKLRGVIAERNFQEQLQLTTTDTICKLKVLNEKQDSLCHTMEGFQSQFRKLFDRLEQIYQNDTLILGRPPTCCYMEDSSNSKSPIMPEPPPLEQSEVRTPNTGEAHLQIIPQGINLFSKLEFPSFDGTAASNWLLRSKSYFQLVPPMNDLQKITLASMHFEGRASRWYQHTCRDIRNLTWDRFSDMISLRFDELKSGKIIGEFNKLRQNSSLAAYIEKFEKLELNRALQMHSSLVQRLSLERELEGHRGCVNTVTWNSEGSLLLSGSDDAWLNIWSDSSRKLMHSIETGHSANIFCAKFIPGTSDELVVSGAGDAKVRLFNLSRLKRSGVEESGINPSAHSQCHTRRIKKLSVEVGNPYVVWSASEDGTLRQHDFRETASCPPSGSSHQECRNILLDLRCGAKKSLVDPPKPSLALKSCDISSTRPHLLLVGGSDAFARLYDRRMLPPLSSSQKKLPPPPCVDFFCPMHLSDLGRSSLHLTHVTFSPNGEEVLLSYSGEHVYLMDVNLAFGSTMRYNSGDVTKATSFSPILNSVKLQPSGVSVNDFPARKRTAAVLDMCRKLIQVAEKSVRGEVNYYYGIEACNEVLDGHDHNACSTHSFLDEILAKKMGCNIEDAFTMNITRVYISKIDALVANFLEVDPCSYGSWKSFSQGTRRCLFGDPRGRGSFEGGSNVMTIEDRGDAKEAGSLKLTGKDFSSEESRFLLIKAYQRIRAEFGYGTSAIRHRWANRNEGMKRRHVEGSCNGQGHRPGITLSLAAEHSLEGISNKPQMKL